MWQANPTTPAIALNLSSYLCNLLLSHWTCAAFAHSDWPHTHADIAAFACLSRSLSCCPTSSRSLAVCQPPLHTLPSPSGLRVNTLWQFSSVRWLCSPFNKVNCDDDDDDPQNTHEDNSSATPTKPECVCLRVPVCVCDSCYWQHFS